MAIKLVGEPKSKKTIQYPKIMISKGRGNVVLFISEKEGICLSDGGYKFGTYSTGWNIGEFTEYNEPVTIQNVIE